MLASPCLELRSLTASLEFVRAALADRYRVEREIGRGASSIVYLAHDTLGQREVAIKVLHAELAQALGGQRFLREIRTAAAMEHPNLVPIHDSGAAGDVLYYTSTYLPEGSLRTRLLRERQLSLEDAITVAKDVAAALEYVHERRILHRDIKPENILFSKGRACVADFGIARAVDSASGDTITSTGLVVGTPTYMSPEQASGDRAVDERSDQYSLACVVYETLAGMPPFIGASAQAVIAQRFAHPALPLAHYRPAAPAHVQAAVARALSLTPADRFASVAAFVRALAEPPPAVAGALAPRPTTAHVVRRRWFVAGATTVVVALAILGFTEGYPRVKAALAPSLDTGRIAVVPFAGAAPALSGSQAADGIYLALSQWHGLQLADDATIRQALADGTRVLSLDEAFAAASAARAGRLIWGRVSARPEGMLLRADLYDVRSRRSLRESSVALPAGADVPAALAALGDVLLRHPELERAPEGELGTRSYAARRAYELAEIAYARGEFTVARTRYSEAAGLDPQFTRTHYGVANTAMLLGEPAASWQEAARRAVATPSVLSRREQRYAAGLNALAEARFPEACEAFAAAHTPDSTDLAVWYSLGECRYLDTEVVPSIASRSGYAFRASHHAAAQSFLRAAQVDSRAYTLPLYRRLHSILKTESGQRRRGSFGGATMVGIPELVADTLAFVPVPPAPDRSVGDDERARHRLALTRNAGTLLAFAQTWAEREPRNPEALEALSDILEVNGRIADAERLGVSALGAVRQARALVAPGPQAIALAVRELRLLVKRGEFGAARRLADSLLTVRDADSTTASGLAAAAALTGRISMARRFARHRLSGVDAGAELPPPAVAERVAALETVSALGVCAQIEPALQATLRAIDAYVAAASATAARQLVLRSPGMWAVPCTRGHSASWSDASAPLLDAQRAFARGDAAGALRVLGGLEDSRRHLPAGEVSLDHTYQETWLRFAAGDTAGAATRLDRVLESLPAHRSSLLLRMPEAAALPRAMILRARIAAARGDAATAARWASAVEELWTNADVDLRSDVEEMRRLAAF
jgi:tRNA A-37 threonylcarbamoyl transferase component Bud32/tetratricopeptide (TPR) repeat protein